MLINDRLTTIFKTPKQPIFLKKCKPGDHALLPGIHLFMNLGACNRGLAGLLNLAE